MTRATEWTGRVEIWRQSGKSAAEFCADRDFTSKSLLWWSSFLRRKGSRGRAKTVTLARVIRRPLAAQSTSAATIVVHLGNARVDVVAGADRTALSMVFELILAASTEARR